MTDALGDWPAPVYTLVTSRNTGATGLIVGYRGDAYIVQVNSPEGLPWRTQVWGQHETRIDRYKGTL